MVAANRWQRAIALVCISSFLLTSCTELRTVAIPHGESPPSWTEVRVGDKVVVTTKTTKKTFTVTAVEPNALVGKGVRIPYDDMATLDVKYIRRGATTALVITIVAIVVIAISANEVAHEFVPN
jgi:hypothetical protein